YIKQIKEGISQVKAGIKAMNGVGEQLAQAQGMLDTTSISAQFQLSNAAAQLAAAQGQISAGIMQIEMGLEQLDDARETALEQSDISSMITMEMISMILKAQNFSMPAGYVKQGFTDYLVKVGDELGSIDELKDMVLMDMGMDDLAPILLSDVAEVFMSDNLSEIYARINGNDGVLLSFSKQSERSTTAVADAILAKFSELSKQYKGLRFTPLLNQGDYIYTVTNSIISDLLWGALFAVIILLLFLRDLRPTFITLCSIPISLVFALVAMYFAGVTINIISLSGLAIAVGRLVDDSVVVIENIFRLRAKGYSPVKAAVTGASQVAGAIVASTLTTICVFLPIVFVEGLTRQLFTDFGLTFAFALLASLAIAMSLVPAMASGMFGKMEPKEHKLLDRLIAGYDRALMWTLRFKPVVLVIVVVLLAGSAWAILNKGFAYMPEGSSGQLAVSLTMPKDTTREERKERADEAMVRLEGIEGVDTVGMISGGEGGTISFLIGSGGSGLRGVTSYVLLEDEADSNRITADIEKALEDIDMEISISDAGGMDASALGGSGIRIEIFGDNPDNLMEAVGIVSEAVSVVEGVAEVDDGLEEATPEINFTVDRAKAAEFGLTTAQVYQRVSAALASERSATSVSWRADSYDVVVVNEYSRGDGLTPDYIKGLSFKVTQKDGSVEEVRLKDITTISDGQAMPTVLRSDQRRYMPVSVSIDEDHNITLMTQEVERVVGKLKLPTGVSYEITGESSTIMDAFNQLGLMLVLGLLLVYLIMVAQFQSLKNPFIIMFTIPLAFTGGFLALLITDKILSVISLIGFAMLVGIIVSNAIVLVDYINRLRLEGMERVAAIREGAATRMRPILMTALATIFALIVMALGIGSGSNMMQPLAIVCIGGLAYGTFMTLFVIPIIYDSFNKKEMRRIDADDLVVDRDA
ncbi:MAG: efflux RND transporter permease subunit, partial [Clostridiales bacterium]|nr:efflux RND transporter permease subunit [Clostridiales bacterium]